VIRFFAILALALLAVFGAPPRAVAKALSDQNIAFLLVILQQTFLICRTSHWL